MRSQGPGLSPPGLLVLALMAHVAAACAVPSIKLYPGPALAGSQVATLWAERSILIKAVDDERMPEGMSGAALQLLPGGHKVQFGYAHEICYYLDVSRGRECKQFSYGDAVLEFEAVGGHAYGLYSGTILTGWRPYIQDGTSGVVVRSEGVWPW